MASISIFSCPGGAQHLVSNIDGTQSPSCDQGEGAWQQVELVEPFSPSQLNSEELSAAFGAGFLVLGTGLVITWAARQLVAAIRSST